jgi:Pyridoxamine 5'-phosphate oxidase
MTVQSWPAGTVVALATQADGPHVIPVSAALRAPGGEVWLALARSRGSLARLRSDPRVAVLVLAAGDIAATLYGPAVVVDDAIADGVAAVRVNVARVAHHERPSFVIESGVSWHWTDATAQARDTEVNASLARLAQTAQSGSRGDC